MHAARPRPQGRRATLAVLVGTVLLAGAVVAPAGATTTGPPVSTAAPSVYDLPPGGGAGTVVLSSDPVVDGETLQVDQGAWSGSPTSFSYQWQQCAADGTGCADLASATTIRYVVQASDVGHRLSVTVTATNTDGSTPVTVDVGQAVTENTGAPLNMVLPQVTGDVTAGSTLSVSNGTWSGPAATFTYQWESCDGFDCTPIAGATHSTYLVQSGDVGLTLKAIVTATNSEGSNFVTSQDADSVAPANTTPPQLTATEMVTVGGSTLHVVPDVGNQLSVSTGTWTGSPTSFDYRWIRCDADSENCATITGETASSYTIASADLGSTIGVDVYATNGAGTSSPAEELVHGVVGAPNPLTDDGSISGTAQVGLTLTANNASSWTGTDPTFHYQWAQCDSNGSSCVNISDATSSTYTAASGDEGHVLSVTISGSNVYGPGGYALVYKSSAVAAAGDGGGGDGTDQRPAVPSPPPDPGPRPGPPPPPPDFGTRPPIPGP